MASQSAQEPQQNNKQQPPATMPVTGTNPIHARPAVITPADPNVPQAISYLYDVLKEYVSGGSASNLLGQYYQTLPQFIDDVTGDFGPDLYERMMFDPKVAGSINLLKLAILISGLKLVSPKTDKNDPDFDRANEIVDFCRRALGNLKKPDDIMAVLWQLLDSLALGYKVAEIIWKNGEGLDAGRHTLSAIKVKPRRVTAFVVDAYMNVAGLLALLPGQGFASILTQGLIGIAQNPADQAPNQPTNLLPRVKFIVSTWQPKDSDPRGSSQLRPAYNAWWIKVQLWPEYLKFLTQYGTPLLVGYTAPKAQGWPAQDALGNPVTPPAGQSQQSPEQTMNGVLTKVYNGMAATFPNGAKAELLQATGDGKAFIEALKLLNSEIAVAILFQNLATGEADHQTGAATGSHQDVLSMVIEWGRLHVEGLVKSDILYQLVLQNFGQDAADRLCPDVSLSDASQSDFALNANAIATLMSSGYLDESQLPDTDARLGLLVRDLKAIAERKLQQQKQAVELMQKQQPAANNQPGQAGPGQGQENKSNLAEPKQEEAKAA